MSLTSTVGIAKTGTLSLRATVPEGIVAFLELESGDKLEWKMEIASDGKRFATIRKIRAVDEATKIASKYAKPKAKVRS